MIIAFKRFALLLGVKLDVQENYNLNVLMVVSHIWYPPTICGGLQLPPPPDTRYYNCMLRTS